MKIIIKYLLIAFLSFFITHSAIGDWDGTFEVVAIEGEEDCDNTLAWHGDVFCQTSLESDNQHWVGYQTYTFNLDAPDSGIATGIVDVDSYSEPIQNCDGINYESWTSPPNPAIVTIVVETD